MARYPDDDDEGHIDMRPLLRLTMWGVCAVVAVSATVLAGRTDVGNARARVALATLRNAPVDLVTHPSNLLASQPSGPDENEQRLAAQVRTLTADRDRLAERVAALEHNLTDLTGSIPRAAATTAAAPNPPPETKAPEAPPAPLAEPKVPPINFSSTKGDDTRTAPAAPPQPGVGQPADVPLPRPGPLATIQSYVNSTTAPGTPQTRLASANPDPPPAAAGSYAIDLGSGTNVNTLRAHWGSVKQAHGAILEGLQPLVSVRQSSRPGFTDFHLIAGPLADADAATRLCAALTSVRVACRPSTFNGQRLDLR